MSRFMSGADLFSLACTSRARWRLLSQDVFWRDRFTFADMVASHTQTAIQRYMRAFSYKFIGFRRDNHTTLDRPARGSTSQVTIECKELFGDYQSLSYDVWFNLLDDSGRCSNRNGLHFGRREAFPSAAILWILPV